MSVQIDRHRQSRQAAGMIEQIARQARRLRRLRLTPSEAAVLPKAEYLNGGLSARRSGA